MMCEMEGMYCGYYFFCAYILMLKKAIKTREVKKEISEYYT